MVIPIINDIIKSDQEGAAIFDGVIAFLLLLTLYIVKAPINWGHCFISSLGKFVFFTSLLFLITDALKFLNESDNGVFFFPEGKQAP